MKDIDDDDENDENNDDNLGNIFRSTFFGDDLFNRNKRNEHKREREREEDEEEKDTQDDDVTMEPADINKNETDEIDDAGMKVEKRKNSINHINKKHEKKAVSDRSSDRFGSGDACDRHIFARIFGNYDHYRCGFSRFCGICS